MTKQEFYTARAELYGWLEAKKVEAGYQKVRHLVRRFFDARELQLCVQYDIARIERLLEQPGRTDTLNEADGATLAALKERQPAADEAAKEAWVALVEADAG